MLAMWVPLLLLREPYRSRGFELVTLNPWRQWHESAMSLRAFNKAHQRHKE